MSFNLLQFLRPIKNSAHLIKGFYRTMHQDKKKDLVISVNSGQLCTLIFWYRPAYRDMQSLTFSVPGVELRRNGTPWFKLIDFTRCLWSVGEANKILEVRLWNRSGGGFKSRERWPIPPLRPVEGNYWGKKACKEWSGCHGWKTKVKVTK